MGLFNVNTILLEILGGIPDQPSFPDGFFQKIIPNLWAFLVQLAALIILIVLFIIFGYKPVKKIMTERKNHIKEEIDSAENNNTVSKENLRLSEQAILDSKKEAAYIIENAKKTANSIKEESLLETEKEIALLKDKAEKDIASSKEKAKDDIKKEIIDVAILASEGILNREVNKKDNEKLVSDFIKDMEKK